MGRYHVFQERGILENSGNMFGKVPAKGPQSPTMLGNSMLKKAGNCQWVELLYTNLSLNTVTQGDLVIGGQRWYGYQKVEKKVHNLHDYQKYVSLRAN
ncbi:MAG TPA: hypothetical protein VFG10_15700 [Saprospiraceae bacterium]|nr:hypothetical protein [Saprospiraceae bacterium]